MKRFNSKSLLLALATLFASSVLFTSCETETDPTNLTETLDSYDELSTLVDALEITSLTSQLNGTAVTIFAPDNAAFDAFLLNNGYESLSDVPVDALKSVLQYHVIGGNVFSYDLTNGYVETLATAQGNALALKVDADNVTLNNTTNITSTDIDGFDGTIHIIDAVLSIPDIVDIAANDGNFTSLVEALVTTGLDGTLETAGPFTVFAPTDDAIQWSTSMGIPLDVLEEILLDHVVSGNVAAADLSDGQLITTLGMDNNSSYSILFDTDGSVKIVETGSNPTSVIATISVTDLQASNGIIHVINNVIVL